MLRNRSVYKFASLEAVVHHLNNYMNSVKENRVYSYSEILPSDFAKEDLVNL